MEIKVDFRVTNNKEKVKKIIIFVATLAGLLLMSVLLALRSSGMSAGWIGGVSAVILTPMIMGLMFQKWYGITITDKKVSFVSSTVMGSEKYEKVEKMAFSFFPSYNEYGMVVFTITADIYRFGKVKPHHLEWSNLPAAVGMPQPENTIGIDVNAIISQLERCEKVVINKYPLN